MSERLLHRNKLTALCASVPLYLPVLPSNYMIDIDVRFFDLFLENYSRNIIRNISLPLTLSNRINITEIDMTTVCGLNGTEYECKCEENHVWPNDTCRAYHECDAIVGGTCGCIQALPSEGPLCQRDINECAISPSVCGSNSTCTNEIGSYNCSCLDGFSATNSNLTISINNTCTDVNECLKTSEFCGLNSYCTNSFGSYNCSCLSGFTVTNRNQPVSTSNPCNGEHRVLPSNYMIDIDVRFFDLFLENYSRNIIRNISLPLTLSNRINITDIDMTTVCGLNGTEYECKCEENHVWPNDTCRAYHECDAIVGGTCGCIQALPSEGPLCQRDINECAISPSVCGSYSTCTNEIGSYNCSCLDGFTATNSSLTISINNTCTDTTLTTTTTTTTAAPNTTTPAISTTTAPNATTTAISTTTAPNATTPAISTTTAPNATTTAIIATNTTTTGSNTTAIISKTTTTAAVNTTTSATTAAPNTITTAMITTTTSNPTSTATSTPTITIPTKPVLFTVKMSMKLEKTFDTSLNDPNDETYKSYAKQIQKVIEDSYQTVSTFRPGSVRVTGFRPGSIITNYEVNSTTNSPANFVNANSKVAETLTIDGIPVPVGDFAESEQKILSTAKDWYPQQDMKLECTRPDSVSGDLSWKLNDKVIQQSDKYTFSQGGSLLTVKSIDDKDKGTYACVIKRDIPYIQWEDIVIEPLPNIIAGISMRRFQCMNQTVQLTCCETKYDVEWTPIPPGDQVTSQDDKGCITLKHKIESADCSSETFTCQLMIPELRVFSYGQSKVTIQKVKEELPCKNETLGDGKYGENVTGPCEQGKEGTITYLCTAGSWKEMNRHCILQVIIDIEKKVKDLVPQDIPAVVAELSTATKNNTNEITQSPVTVQTIVGILVKIADTSKNIIISEPVMRDFLQTVNILVSDLAINSWDSLNNDSRTDNTSIALLSAIENISERLTEANFTINQVFIELNRTVADRYSGISNLTNSTTEILIPQISNRTPITIIVFTTLDNVLPTRNSSKKYTKSDSIINGDVVVVKVNQTINNISFAFDITDQSLGNPQCVFWNFNLDAWDSTGCKVKPYISEGNETGKISCECNHTTSFSILMSPFSLDDNKALAYITYIGVTISMASLILCLIIETIVWKSMTRNDTSYMRHVSIVNIAVSLLIANICFIIGAAVAEQEQPTSVGRCSPAVFFMHFFYLALFFWMLISALLLFYRTVMVLSQMSRAKMMAIAFIVGYGAPLLIAVITVASTAGPQNYITKQYACWLNWNESKALLAFVIPALTIVAINLVVLIVVLYKMLRRGVGATTQPDEKHALVVIARCVAILTPIFGLTWGFGIGTMVSREIGIHVVFALLNSLQGFFILVFGTLLDSKIREALAERLSLRNLTSLGNLRNLTSSNRTRSTSAGPSSSSEPGFFQRMRRRRNMYNVSEVVSAATSSNISSGANTFSN
ncbi:adhesion G protein-coupled receptor F5-like [Pseudorasbora parva]|uniref:adhesion G protein-coupled receptor F5-like n=1 Tax=Pseudorasbora parva TaxID=51549 RepID=UPI00351E70C9